MTTPLVSVLLSVYNGSLYVKEAVDSVLRQTYGNLELIVIDDGSTDNTAEIVAGSRDPRVRLVRQENRGVSASVNRGVALGRGRYIARQDHDDMWHPERLARQLSYLQANPGCMMVGTWAEIWNEAGPTGRMLAHPAESALLKLELLFNNPFVQSSVLIDREALEDVGGYSEDPKRQPPEDYELWSRLARRYEIGNIQQPLVVYREVAGSQSRSTDRNFWLRVLTICSENMEALLGPDYDPGLIRQAAALAVDYDFSAEIDPPSVCALGGVMTDLALAHEQRYPAYRKQIRTRIISYYHGMLFSILCKTHNRFTADLLTRFFKYRYLGALRRGESRCR